MSPPENTLARFWRTGPKLPITRRFLFPLDGTMWPSVKLVKYYLP